MKKLMYVYLCFTISFSCEATKIIGVKRKRDNVAFFSELILQNTKIFAAYHSKNNTFLDYFYQLNNNENSKGSFLHTCIYHKIDRYEQVNRAWYIYMSSILDKQICFLKKSLLNPDSSFNLESLKYLYNESTISVEKIKKLHKKLHFFYNKLHNN